jgi:monoamine oxidase
MGSYSYLPVGSTLKWIRALAKPVNKKIFFAGEATSLTDMSTTNGAYQTGRRAAAQVIKALKRS